MEIEKENEKEKEKIREQDISSPCSSIDPADEDVCLGTSSFPSDGDLSFVVPASVSLIIPTPSLDPVDEMSRVLRTLTRTEGDPLHVRFSLPSRQVSCFLSKFVQSLFFHNFLKIGQRCQGSCTVLILPYTLRSLLPFFGSLLVSCVVVLSRN